MTEAYIGIGSNLGDPLDNVDRAFELIERAFGVFEAVHSPRYRSAPIGFLDQDWFVNSVAKIMFEGSAHELLSLCQKIEMEFKRERSVRWGPRTIDLDIVAFGDETVREANLQLPHPRAVERAFVLRPLMDLNPKIVLQGKLVSDWLGAIQNQQIERISP